MSHPRTVRDYETLYFETDKSTLNDTQSVLTMRFEQYCLEKIQRRLSLLPQMKSSSSLTSRSSLGTANRAALIPEVMLPPDCSEEIMKLVQNAESSSSRGLCRDSIRHYHSAFRLWQRDLLTNVNVSQREFQMAEISLFVFSSIAFQYNSMEQFTLALLAIGKAHRLFIKHLHRSTDPVYLKRAASRTIPTAAKVRVESPRSTTPHAGSDSESESELKLDSPFASEEETPYFHRSSHQSVAVEFSEPDWEAEWTFPSQPHGGRNEEVSDESDFEIDSDDLIRDDRHERDALRTLRRTEARAAAMVKSEFSFSALDLDVPNATVYALLCGSSEKEPVHPAFAVTFSNMGMLCFNMGWRDHALACSNFARSIRNLTIDPCDFAFVDTGSTYNNIGVCLHDLACYEDADVYFTAADHIFASLLTHDHPRSALARLNRARNSAFLKHLSLVSAEAIVSRWQVNPDPISKEVLMKLTSKSSADAKNKKTKPKGKKKK